MPTIDKGQQREAIATVENQTSGLWNLVVGGDGYLPAFTSEDDRIGVVEIPRKGEAGLVRNAISEYVNTEWIGFLDDDDELLPTYVETWERNQDCDCMVFQMDNYGQLLPPTGTREAQFGFIGISFAVKISVFKNHPFDGQGQGEDYRFVYTLQNAGYNVRFLDTLGYLVRPYLKRV